MHHDLRLAIRRVRHARAFSLSVIVILGVGIGSTTAMFSIFNALAFRSLALPDARSLVAVMSLHTGDSFRRPTPLNAIAHLRSMQLPADGWCASSSVIEATESDGRVLEAYGELMAGDCEDVIRMSPALGRWFDDVEAPFNGPGRPVMVITDRYWRRMFDGRPDVLGRTVRVGAIRAQVIGVMPEGFRGFSPEYAADFIVPFNAHRPAPGAAFFLGRLHEGASIEQIESQVTTMWPSVIDAVTPQGPTRAQTISERRGGVEAFSGGSSVLRRLYAVPVRNMAILSAGLFLLVWVNVGGLWLARVADRMQESAAMRALGADGKHIARPLFVEAMIYAAAGSFVGIPMAYAGSAAFANLLPWANIPWTVTLTPDARILTGVIASTTALAMIIAALPAWVATRRTSLQQRSRTASRATHRLAQGLIVAQIAATLVLVFTGGLLLRSFDSLWRVDRGFSSDGVLSIRLVPDPGGYEKFDQAPYYRALLQSLKALPGVESAAFARYFGTINTSLPPLPVAFVGEVDRATGVMEYVSPGFFETVGIPLLSGRDVTWDDLPSTPKVAMVSHSLARALDPNGDVVGRVIRYGTDPATAKLEIIGTVGNISLGNFRDREVRVVYMSGVQAGQGTYATAHLRAVGDPLALARPATALINGSGREHVQRAVPVDFLFTNGVVAERMATVAGTAAAILALMIASIGLFAMLSHSVAGRSREIGIRIAVGASPSAVTRLIVRDAAVVVLGGLMIGMPAAVAASRLVRSMLFEVTYTDIVTVSGSGVALAMAAVLASIMPALRATRIEPSVTLRAE
jgi:predicted permease